ncbi:serine/threonine-protein kinase Chk1 [Rhizoctonia solani]|uniref:non-specific serine/threonine protein kinase n=1 Tax=Rhizoctonia solani TaxID=456999 RepID=A0A0K6G6M5_9AGAM|nr:serine/threonine-protein kinase Chk1 [Rhizoctonia solani]
MDTDVPEKIYPKVGGYSIRDCIGGGGFSRVFRAINYETRATAACKVVLITSDTPSAQRKDLEKEIKVHSLLKHINVLEFLRCKTIEESESEKYVPGVYMLLELASGGDLFDKIAPDVGVDIDLARFYFTQLIAGVEFIHSQGVCHRDLKPENLLLNLEGRLKISDFGLCSVFKYKERVRMLSERCGSLPYVAPELSTNEPYAAEPVDVWGTGVILFTLFVGNTPWDEPTASSPEFVSYARGEIFQYEPWSRIEPEALAFLRSILTITPKKRATIAQIKAHPWFNRPSHVERANPQALAERLTQNLRRTGDLSIAAPDPVDLGVPESDMDVDSQEAGDRMMTLTNATQFTRSLLLFSQTQGGTRYTPALTRFYASLPPDEFLPILVTALQGDGVKCAKGDEDSDDAHPGRVSFRIGGLDKRREQFRGTIELEPFRLADREVDGSFVIMSRERGNPLSWRQLWKQTVLHANVKQHVLMKGH